MGILNKASNFLILVLISDLLSSCNVFNEYSRLPGITYVTSLGKPPADAIVWSPKGSTKILVSANDPIRHNSQVYIVDIVTKKKTMLVNAEYGETWGTTWLPDGKHIELSVVSGTQGFSGGGLWVVNTEDNSREYFLDGVSDALWLPDGKTLALQTLDFTTDQKPQPIEIALMDIQTRKLVSIYSNQTAAAFGAGFSSSPDGQYVVFSLLYDFTSLASDVYILNVRAGTVNQLTHDSVSSSPQWSPHGDLIAYEKKHGIGNQSKTSLHITLPDGSCDVEIPKIDYAISPTWSPDGKQLAFTGPDGIYVIDLEKFLGRDIYQNLCQ